LARVGDGSIYGLQTLSTEGMMRLHDVYGSDLDRFSLEREVAWRDFDPPQLEWDESEVSALVDDIVAQHRCAE
jgi:hypothetical protein